MSNNNAIRTAPADSQSPQASASAIPPLAQCRVTVDRESVSQEKSAESSLDCQREKFPGDKLPPRFSDDGTGKRRPPQPNLLVAGRDGWTPVTNCNSAQTGALRELRVAADLMERGHQVFRNLAPGGIDLVAYIRGTLVRVEVATASRRVDGTIVPPGKDPRCEFDLLAAVLQDGTIAYFGFAP